MPDNTAVPGTEAGENFFERITPEGTEEKAGQDIRVHDSEQFAKQHLRPEEGEPEFLSVEDAARKLSERRAKSNDLVRFERDGRRGPQTSEQAVSDLTFSKRVARADAIKQAHPSLTHEQAVEAAVRVEKGPIDAYTLDKADKAHPLSRGDTTEEARDRLTELRRARAAEIEALRAAEAESLQQPQDATAGLSAQAAPEAQAPEARPPEPPPVDPLEQERQRVQQEAATLATLRNLSTQEIQLAHEAQQLNAFITQKYGAKVQQAGGLEALGKIDPGAVNEILQAKQAFDHRVGQAQYYAQLRQQNEAQLQHMRTTELARVNAAEREKADQEFEAYVSRADPEWKSPDYRQQLARISREVIEEVAPNSWAALQSGAMYVTKQQQIALHTIAKARLSEERVKEAMKNGRQAAAANLPPVQRPGVSYTRGELAGVDQSARLARLPSLSGIDGAREGARILAERRRR